MTINEIKQAIANGQPVYWSNTSYIVIQDSIGQYLIKCLLNDDCIGLTNKAGDKLNGNPEDFYTIG